MRAPPPGDEPVRLAAPALLFEQGRDRLDQPFPHVDNGTVLVERQRLDLMFEGFASLYGW